MTANCSRLCALQSTLAPTSSRVETEPVAVGIMATRAGRSTPGKPPSTILAVAIAAPVLPAEMNAEASPLRTSRNPTRMVESRLVRTACTALSSMEITSLAWQTEIGSEPAKG